MRRARPDRLAAVLGIVLLASAPRALAQTPIQELPTGGGTAPAAPTAPAPRAAPVERVVKVQFQGNLRVESDALLRELLTRVDDLYSAVRLAEDVKRLWRLGKFEDIQVDRRGVAGGVVLTFIVKEKPSIRKITVNGNKEVDIDKVNEVLDLKKGQILNASQIKKNAEKIREQYLDKGYYLADVTFQVVHVDARNVDVIFEIVEGQKIEVRKVSFVGTRAVKAEELEKILRTQSAGYFSFLTSSGTYKDDVFQKDQLLIRAYYYDKGYINVSLSRPHIVLSPDRRYMYITINVDEGQQYRIGDVDVKGDFLGSDADQKAAARGDKRALARLKAPVLRMLKTKPGSLFNRSKLGEDIIRLTDYYKNRGYAFANITPLTNIDMDKRIVHLTFELEKGKMVTIERINISGNTKTRDKVIRREMIISEGDDYSAVRIEVSKKRITALGYFKDVKVKTKQGSGDDKIVLNVRVTERPTGTFNVGAGFSSVENFIAQAQVSQDNLFGRGQSLTLQAQLSSLRQLFLLRFTEPYFFDSKWTFAFSLWNSLTNYESFNRNASGGSLTWGYPLTYAFRVYLTYKLEHVKVDTSQTNVLLSTSSRLTIPSTAYIANLFNDGLSSSIRGTLAYDTRNNRLFPSKGMYHSLSAEFAAPWLGSQNVFNRYELFTRFYVPIWNDLIIKLNAEAGMVVSTQKTGVPIFERFFVGGINSVRGFRPRTLGPRVNVPISPDPSAGLFAFPKGGNKELLFNLEVEFPIFTKVGIKGVIFFDAGNAFDDDETFTLWSDVMGVKKNRPMLRTAVGFGFRWFSPIGPLRFEWGIPLVRQPGEERIVFEFTIGNFF
jgi:outer membrane protein insertion porin family